MNTHTHTHLTQGSVEDVFCFTFQITEKTYGDVRLIDLIDDGANIAVTFENRREFVSLYVDYFVNRSVKHQFNAFSKGFHRLQKDTYNIYTYIYNAYICI